METIRFCQIEELEKLQQFIHTYWKAHHILSKHKALLEFQHLNKVENQINYAVAVNEAGEFTAAFGFISPSQYDADIAPVDLWGTTWFKSDQASKGIGQKLLSFLIDHYKARTFAGLGISNTATEIFKKMGYTTGKLNQYYYHKAKFNISKPKGLGYWLSRDITTIHADQIKRTPQLFNKSFTYFINRYQNHPVYTYDFLCIQNENKDFTDLLVIRENTANINGINRTCLRIIDSYNHFKGVENITDILNDVLDQFGAEYIDCLNYGIPAAKFEEMGFKKRIGDEIIIPTYFEPFEQRNVDINFAYKILNNPEQETRNKKLPVYADEAPYIIFKGDSDQDRPNLIQRIKRR